MKEDMRSIDILSQYYQAFNNRDYERMLSLVTEDLQHFPNQGSLRVGKAVFREFLLRMDHCYREQVTELTLYEAGNRAAADFVIEGVYLENDEGLPRAQGQRYILPVGTFFTIASGKISSIRNYYNLEDWIAQVSGNLSSGRRPV